MQATLAMLPMTFNVLSNLKQNLLPFKAAEEEKERCAFSLEDILKRQLDTLSEIKEQGDIFLDNNVMPIRDKIEQSLIERICQCYQAFIQIYQIQHKEDLQTWKEKIDFREIDKIVEEALQDFLNCEEAIAFNCFLQMGIPERLVKWVSGTSPIPLDINKISNFGTCLDHFTQQAPYQTTNIQQLTAKTNDLFQERAQYGLTSACKKDIQEFVLTKTKAMLSKG